jgi:hypothetical protein
LKSKRGFVYSKARFNENGELEIELCPRLLHATSQLRGMWGNHRTSPLGLWKNPTNVFVPVVSRDLGQADELEGNGNCFFNEWDSVYRAVQWVVHWELYIVSLLESSQLALMRSSIDVAITT